MTILPANWAMGAFVTALGLLGLVLASKAVDVGMYAFGLLLFAFATGFVFWLIKRAFDESETS
jgi:uncharacterized membrane protein